jgi:hypothetical protein
MKTNLLLSILIFSLVTIINCNGQPKSDYEIATPTVTGVTKYHFFIEKKSTSPYHLTDNMDYLNPNVTTYKVGESAASEFTINLVNDNAEYIVGVVLENASGYYSGMTVATGMVGIVPFKPASVIFRKKN